MDIYSLHQGSAPLLISLPHDGEQVPSDVAMRLTPSARCVPDTDWGVARLYAFAREMGASLLVPRYSRYVVDLNRSSDDTSLYPGQNTTGLCPHVQFSGEPVYLPEREPDAEEIASRVQQYWLPYHQALQAELQRLREAHGRVVLWEAHSIRSELPFLFEGVLPDFNLGTASGSSCSALLQERLAGVLESQADYSHIVNGRFKGGFITRHYGQPQQGVDAVQLELAQSVYMDEASARYLPPRAAAVQPTLQRLLEVCLQTCRELVHAA
ncbi:MAG: N-formylglutamate deformylase [Dokdonella sp.]